MLLIIIGIILIILLYYYFYHNVSENFTETSKPNILVIMGDDIGMTNLSIYSNGLLGYKTPNIDSIGKDGILFTDSYAEQSCTAGRAAFITGQSPYRTGMLKVGMPGYSNGLSLDDPTLALLLKNEGYNTGQFGKNHLGDTDADLPTNHGFDTFYGNLYHLNAEEEPENVDYPDIKEYPIMKKYKPRGIIYSTLNSDGTQNVQDTGPLTKKRMETVDQEFLTKATGYINKSVQDNTPFFVWFNTTAMHFRTRPNPEIIGQSGKWRSVYHDVMIEHDKQVGELLKIIPENTIVIYTTDNGPHLNSWPDAGTTPFRSEKNTNWEGGFRVPLLMKYPKIINPNTVLDGIVSLQDLLPTLMNFAGVQNIKEKLLNGYQINNTVYNVHLDGYDMSDYFIGNVDKSPRKEFFYFSDEADLLALRFDVWKFVFAEQRETGTLEIWSNPFVYLRFPKIFNLKTDPFEVADRTSNIYWDWVIDHLFLIAPAQEFIVRFFKTFEKYPRRQNSTTFTISKLLEHIEKIDIE